MNISIKEEYFGCDCGSLGHTVRFCYFPPNKDTPSLNDVDNCIYIDLFRSQWRNTIIPPYYTIKDYFTFSYWRNYFYISIFNKIYIVIKHIFNNYKKEDGIFDGVILKSEDFDRLKNFLVKGMLELYSKDHEKINIFSNDFLKIEKNICEKCIIE